MLTARKIEIAKPLVKPFKLFDARGLFLLVTPSGGKWWRINYRFAGKQKTLSLGVYPDVGMRDARNRRDVFRTLISKGIDPSEYRKAERLKQRIDKARAISAMRFTLDNDGALSFRLGDSRRLFLTAAETAELRSFLDATRALAPKVKLCP